MAVAEWTAGELIQPGDVRRPVQSGDVSQTTLDNANFDLGDQDWTTAQSGGTVSRAINTDAPVFDGTYSLKIGVTANDNGASGICTNDARVACEPGDVVEVNVYARANNSASDPSRLQVEIVWFNSGGAEILSEKLALDSTPVGAEGNVIDANGLLSIPARGIWYPLNVVGIAPAAAATWTIRLTGFFGDDAWIVDGISQVQAAQEAPNTLLFRATQTDPGYTGGSEPDWPTTVGLTVVDNEVTWTAIAGNNITWEASRILVTASSEPTWPTGLPEASVVDNTITWRLDSRRVKDTKCPNSAVAAIGASKVFAADEDLVGFSATVNALDWSTDEDAGYLPFGLQDYGGNDVAAMALYRGNLIAFNSEGAQVWQIDEDPAGMAYLDSIPISCTYPRSIAPVGDDLAFLSKEGARSLGQTGSQVNLQGGWFGKAIDPLVTAAIAQAVIDGVTPLGLYWPAQGQYWLIFGDEAYVLTINGPGRKQRSWSRYTFPHEIDDWTILGDDLYLRSGDLVWIVDEDVYTDDTDSGGGQGGDDDAFQGVIQWPALDFGNLGEDKELIGYDITADGNYNVSIGWDQANLDYDVSGPWTPLQDLSGDLQLGQRVPESLTAPSFSLRIIFDAGAAFEWFAASFDIKDRVN